MIALTAFDLDACRNERAGWVLKEPAGWVCLLCRLGA